MLNVHSFIIYCCYFMFIVFVLVHNMTSIVVYSDVILIMMLVSSSIVMYRKHEPVMQMFLKDVCFCDLHFGLMFSFMQ